MLHWFIRLPESRKVLLHLGKLHCGINDELCLSPKCDSLEKLIIQGIEMNSIGEVI